VVRDGEVRNLLDGVAGAMHCQSSLSNEPRIETNFGDGLKQAPYEVPFTRKLT
jgi:hypothetical protein